MMFSSSVIVLFDFLLQINPPSIHIFSYLNDSIHIVAAAWSLRMFAMIGTKPNPLEV